MCIILFFYVLNKKNQKIFVVMTLSIFLVFNLSLDGKRVARSLTTEEFLIKTDKFLDEHVSRCNNYDLTGDQAGTPLCINLLKNSWLTLCAPHVYHDKLDTCKNGKIETYLKKHGGL